MATASSSNFRAIFWAWLIAGTLDIASFFAICFWKSVAITRGLQGIAAGVVGREAALQGGMATALLGLSLHFLIMLAWVVFFFSAGRILPALAKRPLASGIVYGFLVYIIMYWVVVPSSRIGP